MIPLSYKYLRVKSIEKDYFKTPELYFDMIKAVPRELPRGSIVPRLQDRGVHGIMRH